ncbi:MAG: alanine/glycine:cation symporter family protein [Massiliimalia sp.]|jgi:AGCS family alanine or glycine:cation symporter
MNLNHVLTAIDDWMYTYILIILLIACGVYFTVRCGFAQLRFIKDAFRVLKEKAQQDQDGHKKVSSFQALMISTASRVGTGNIAGIATALVAGGPGAVFWMWLMAIIGGASAFVESTLAQIYKVPDGKQFRGGPSYYIQIGMGKRWLGVVFSILLICCFAYGFNGLQAFNMSSALEYYIPNYAQTIWPAVVGALLAAATGLVIFGGVKRIGFITSVLVPIMAGAYILVGLYTMVTRFDRLPEVIAMIFQEAFDFQAIFGGFVGSAVLIGIKKGLFSNEAGMGSAPNASATAQVSHPVKQGLVQVLSVFIDTLLICSTTAFLLLLSGVEGKPGQLDGIPYVQAAISENVGTWGIHFITLSIFAFAFSSLIGNYYYAESNILFIKDNQTVLNAFRCTCLVAIFLGAQADFTTIWSIADILMGCMAIVNIFALFCLGGVAVNALHDYQEQRRRGLDPVFRASNIGLTNTKVWKDDES